jgi:hypothetical protein
MRARKSLANHTAFVGLLGVLSLVLTACSATQAKWEIYNRATDEMASPNDYFYVRWLTPLTPYASFYSGTASSPLVSRQLGSQSKPRGSLRLPRGREPEPEKPPFQPFGPHKIHYAPQPSYALSLTRVLGLPEDVKIMDLYFWDVPEPRFWVRGYGFITWMSLDRRRFGEIPVSWWRKEWENADGTMVLTNSEMPKVTFTYPKPGKHNVVLAPVLIDLRKLYGEQADPPFIAYDPNTGIIRRVSQDGKMVFIGKLKGWKKPVRREGYWFANIIGERSQRKSWLWNLPGGDFYIGPMKRGDPPYILIYAEQSGTVGLMDPATSRLLFQRSLNMPIENIEMTYDEEKGEGYIVLIAGRGQNHAVVFDRFGNQVVRLRYPEASPGNPIPISEVHPLYDKGKRLWYARAGETFVLIWDEEGQLVQWLDPEGYPGRPGRVKPGEYLIPVATREGTNLLLDATGLVVGSVPSFSSRGHPSFMPLDIDGDGIHEWVSQDRNALFVYGAEERTMIRAPVIPLPANPISASVIAALSTPFPVPADLIRFHPLGGNSLLLCRGSTRRDYESGSKRNCVFIPDVRTGKAEQMKSFPEYTLRPTYDVSGDGLRDFFSARFSSDDTTITVTIRDFNQRVVLEKMVYRQKPSRERASVFKYRGSLFISVPKEGARWPDPSRESILLEKGSGSGEPPPFSVMDEVAVMRGGRIYKAFRTSYTQAVLEDDPDTRVPFVYPHSLREEDYSGGRADLVVSEGKAYLIDSSGAVILALAPEGYKLALGYGSAADTRRCFRETLPTLQNPRYIAFICRVNLIPEDLSPEEVKQAQRLSQINNLSLLVLVGEGQIRAGLYETEGALSGIMLTSDEANGSPQIIGITTAHRKQDFYLTLVRVPAPPTVYREPIQVRL